MKAAPLSKKKEKSLSLLIVRSIIAADSKKIYYKGDKNKWDKITIYSYNEDLTNATRYYYSETKPATSGNFWHYNSKNEIEEW